MARHIVILCLLSICLGCAETPGEPVMPIDMAPMVDVDMGLSDTGGPDTEVENDVGLAEDATLPPDGTTADMEAGDMAQPEPDTAVPMDPLIEIGMDTDGDGLDDGWEQGAADEALLDWQNPDSDGDGVEDGAEDFDLDSLTCLQEQAAGRFPRAVDANRPHPFQQDLLIELDVMTGQTLEAEIMQAVMAAYADVPNEGVAGETGIAVHFYLDQQDVTATEFDGSFEQRQQVLARNGPQNLDGTLPTEEMVHVVVAERRTDEGGARGGEVVTHNDNINRTGLFLYPVTVREFFPQCGLDDPVDPIIPVTIDEALMGTLIHELGHVLQLGHDTEVGGGFNYYNVMSVPPRESYCRRVHQRYHGEENDDPTLGATSEVGESRLSDAAANLIDLTNKLSVETSRLVDGDNGQEM